MADDQRWPLMTDQALIVRLSTTTTCPGDVFDAELEPRDLETLGGARSVVIELVCHHDCRKVDVPSSRLSYARQSVELHNGEPATRSVQIEVPDDAPISFNGKLIRNQWSVEVRLDIARARDVHLANLGVLVVPRNGSERWTSPHPLR